MALITVIALAVSAVVAAYLVGQARGIVIERRRAAARDRAAPAETMAVFGSAGRVQRRRRHLRSIR